MDLKDATLMLLSESAGHPAVAAIAQSAYDRLAADEETDYRVLNDLIGEASGKGVLRALHKKYSPEAYEAIIRPILKEIDRQAPVRPRERPAPDPEDDPLTAPAWPSR
ncbi:MAG TPA: hypothetical protein VKG80_04530 [Trebonia sp.]|nr:hypothetical protein [Trebonia sp.]